MVLLAINFDNLHQILQNLYTDMMPLCSQMTGVAKGLAGLGALFFVAYRVWQSLARAEPVDVFPLLRPFALGLCSRPLKSPFLRDIVHRQYLANFLNHTKKSFHGSFEVIGRCRQK